jgi:alkanesulfonate monooxygenase SsuD/methylene tetrahydromethanopterin reductase-like flavin-dependent oxidoreductase (luciferase family)
LFHDFTLASRCGGNILDRTTDSEKVAAMARLGLAFDLRHPAALGASAPATYRNALDMISWGEDHDFTHVVLGEHHQSPDGYCPQPLVMASAVGGRTERIRVRVSVLLGPLYNPVALAEQVAVADLCLQGRLDLGIGAGYVEHDFHAFGAEYHTRGKHLDWLVPFLRQAWTGEPFVHNGVTIQITPRPCQDPMPIHLGGGSKPAIDRAARIADGYFHPAMQRPWEYYRKACGKFGKPDPGPWPGRGPIFLWVTTGDKEAAWERLAPHIKHQIDSYGGWTKEGLGRPDGPFVPTRDIESLSQGGAYTVLDPDEAVELIDDLGPNAEMNLNPLLAGIDPDDAWQMLRTVEQHVLPNLAR